MNRELLFTSVTILVAVLMSVAEVTAKGPQPQGAQVAVDSGLTEQGRLNNADGPIYALLA